MQAYTRTITEPSLLADDLLSKLPNGFALRARSQWLQLANQHDDGYQDVNLVSRYPVADHWLKDITQHFENSSLPFDIAASDSDIVAFGRVLALRFQRLSGKYQLNFGHVFVTAAKYVDVLKMFVKPKFHHYGLEWIADYLSKTWQDRSCELFVNARHTCQSIMARFLNASFWSKQMRKMAGRELETIIRNHLGFVHRRNQLYVSNEQLRRRTEQKARNLALLAMRTIINELGESFQLDSVVAGSIANPAVRRAELITRIAGFAAMAEELGHAGEFITLTCPSRFHARTEKHSKRNPKFDGSTPLDAQAYLTRVWSRICSHLDREEIKIYGFRVTEPHHDGCPHWHGLFFMEPEHRERFRQIMALHGCREDRKELKLFYHETRKDAVATARKQWEFHCKQAAYKQEAKPTLKSFVARQKVEAEVWQYADYKLFHQVSARVLFKELDLEAGSVVGYISKYISKNIDGKNNDGESIGADFESEEHMNAIDAALRVDAWSATWGIRQFQQIGGAPVSVWRELRRLRISQWSEGEKIERAAAAADVGDWGKFTMLMGGLELSARERPIKLYKEDLDTTNAYGEMREAVIQGVIVPSTGELQYSREHVWTMVNSKSAMFHSEVLTLKGGDSPAWTRVNNSTKMRLGPKKFSDEAIKSMMDESTKLLRHFNREEASEMAEWILRNNKVIDFKAPNKQSIFLIYADLVAQGERAESEVVKYRETIVVEDKNAEEPKTIEVIHGKLLKDFENFNHFYNAMRREYRIRAEAAKPAAIHELELQAAHLRNEIATMEADFMRPLKRMAKRTAGLFDLSRQGIAAISNTPTNPSVAEMQREFLQEQAAKRRRTQERTLDKLLPETEQLIERMKARQIQ